MVFAAYNNAPWGSIARALGPAPAAKGDPAIGVSVPPLWTENPSTHYGRIGDINETTRSLRRHKSRVAPAPPTANGDPATSATAPSAPAVKTPTLPSTGSAVNRKLPFGKIASEVGWAPTAIGIGAGAALGVPSPRLRDRSRILKCCPIPGWQRIGKVQSERQQWRSVRCRRGKHWASFPEPRRWNLRGRIVRRCSC